MSHSCKSCSRTNPDDARYCYFDGALLNGHGSAGPLAIGTQPFPLAFVFPSGRSCQNFDQLALACWNERAEALEALKEGDLARFLSGLGRADLAKAARDAAKAANLERALDDLLDKLPGSSLKEPQLDVQPAEINVGVLTGGQDSKVKLRIANTGMRMLTGSITCKDCVWLSIGESGARKKVFQFTHDLEIPLHIHGQRVPANSKPQEGHLVVESNGGNLIVTVRVEVPVKAFPIGVAAGSVSPRQLSEKALKQPREMAPLFENGTVAKWYKDNGWDYPVQGPTSSGFGAIQQYFEALGLARPPKVELNVSKITLQGKPGETVTQQVEVQTQENRMVYALGGSNQPWLKVEPLPPRGKTAPLRLVAKIPDQPGETLEAKVALRANGNQRFVVPVTLTVAGVRRAAPPPARPVLAPPRSVTLPMPEGFGPTPAAVPVAAARPATLPMPAGFAPPAPVTVPISVPTAAPAGFVPDVAPAGAYTAPTALPATGPVTAVVAPPAPRAAVALDDHNRRTSAWIHLLPGILLPLVLLGMFVVHDVGLKPPALPPEPALEDEEDPALLDSTPRVAINFHDKLIPTEKFDEAYKASGPTMRFGLVMPLELIEDIDTSKSPPTRITRPKRLTYDPKGRTNNTCLILDSSEVLFGHSPGRWQDFSAPLGKDSRGTDRLGRRSVWFYQDQGVRVTQTVEIVRGASSRLLDTCLVRYQIENNDSRAHTVGLRVMLDTLIGDNDGVPFLLPGQKGLCDTTAEFNKADEVPDFIQALEANNLERPGTVAHLQLRVGGGLEAPSRVTLGAWPDLDLQGLPGITDDTKKRILQNMTLWDVPVLPMNSVQTVTKGKPADSCVVMYWPQEPLAPGRTRLVGFTYGLESVKSTDTGGKLAVTVGGSFQVGGEFEVAAYVKDPVAGQKLTLTLPAGLELVNGSGTRDVPPLEAGATRHISTVSWRVKSSKAGKYTFKVESSLGQAETKSVVVKEKIFLD